MEAEVEGETVIPLEEINHLEEMIQALAAGNVERKDIMLVNVPTAPLQIVLR